MRFDHGRVTFLTKKNSEKAKLPQICISFGGSMQIAQIKSGHLTPSPTLKTPPLCTVDLFEKTQSSKPICLCRAYLAPF